MKNIFLTLFLVISTFGLLHSQSISKLDDKNGFKQLKLGSQYSDFSGLKFEAMDGTDQGVYKYLNPPSDLLSVFNHQMQYLYLGFEFKDGEPKTLVYILIGKLYYPTESDFYKKCLDDNFSVSDKYKTSIGPPDYVIKNSTKKAEIGGVGWNSKNVVLKVESEYYGWDQGARLNVKYFLRSYLDKSLDEGF